MYRTVITALLVIASFATFLGCSDTPLPATPGDLPDGSVSGDGDIVNAALAIATVTPATTKAGEPATVDCTLQDSNGLALPAVEYTLSILPEESVSLVGTEVTAETVGEYKILCTFAAAPTVPQTPATWTVVAGEPTELVLTLDPEKPGYAIDDTATVRGHTRDAFGNIGSEDVALGGVTADPEPGIWVKEALLTFEAAGTYTVTAHHADDSAMTASLSVVVDDTPPVIDVISPPRGSTGQDAAPISVSGTVTDATLSVDWFRAMDSEQTFDAASGAFSFEWPQAYGINILALSAADVAGNVTETWRAAGWSSAWYALNPPKLEKDAVPSGMVITLAQAAMDDGVHDINDVNDIATLVEIVMANLDLQALLAAEPLGEFLGCEYILTKMEFDNPKQSFQLGNGVLLSVLTLENLKIWIKNSGANTGVAWLCTLNDGAPDGTGLSTGPLKFEADKMIVNATITLTVENGSPTASAEIDSVDFENMWGIDIPVIQDIVDWAIETFVTLIKPLINGALADAVQSIFGEFAINQDLELPSLDGGEPNIVRLETALSSFLVTPDSLSIAMDGTAYALDGVRPYDVIGSVSYEGCEPTVPLPTDPPKPLQVGLHVDLLNQILFGVWDAGTLNTAVDATALADVDLGEFGIEDLVAELDARLPLVFNTCGGDPRIQIGDLRVDASFSMQGQATQIGLWIQGEAPVQLAIVDTDEGKQIGFELEGLDDLIIEIVQNEGFFEEDDAILLAVMQNVLLPQLLQGLSGGLGTFPLPDIPLSELAPGLPADASFGLNVNKLETKGGYIQLLGTLD